MKIIIRPARGKDVLATQKLCELHFQLEKKKFDPSLDPSWCRSQGRRKSFYQHIKDSDQCVFVAVHNNKIIGHIHGNIIKEKDREPYRNIKKQAELGAIFVLKEYRSKKIGSELMKKFIKWARRKKVDNIKIGTYSKNFKSQKFYHRYGFKAHTLYLEKNFKL